VSSYALSILCKKRKATTFVERAVHDWAVKGYHNTHVMELSEVCKGSIISGPRCSAPWVTAVLHDAAPSERR